MSLPPSFLEELRMRVPLPEFVGRKVKLTRRGREFTGLCPFHAEKSPSFTVKDNEFFHCFGCGAHGDVIGFVMRAENLGFMEAVERLASEAGIEVPRLQPQDREKREQEKTLYTVMEAACRFYEGQLTASAGAEARAYLAKRGLEKEPIERFRLGYAPQGNSLLKQHLLREFPEDLIEQAGLARAPEDGRDSYDYFRNRVMFPILDRKGRVIAFGGRVLGDAKPKYLNSPDTPIFHKGHVLYGLSWARDGVDRGAELIVTEGYMDVIALHRAGFEGAVAPLGTALTEAQLEELWRLAPEPILCFDGDAAGQRAASRAIDRALPLLKPGHSLRFAVLTGGEDPDTLIARFGASAMRAVLAAAQPLVEALWVQELAKAPVDTPERRADFVARLQARSRQITHAGVQDEYARHFKDLVYKRLRARTAPRGARRVEGGRVPARASEASLIPLPQPQPPVAIALRRRQERLLRLILDHPWLLGEIIEELAAIELPAADLDRLRLAVIEIHSRVFPLDAEALNHHLSSAGLDPRSLGLYGPVVDMHLNLGESAADRDFVRAHCRDALDKLRQPLERPGEIARAVQRFGERSSDDTNAHVVAVPWQVERERQERAAFENESESGFPAANPK